MGFHDIVFPTDISWGSQGGPGIPTAVAETDSGQEERVQRYSTPRHRYNAAYNVKKYDTLAGLKAFYLARGGLANGFLYKDWFDYNTTAYGREWGGDDPGSAISFLDQAIATGDGTSTRYQLAKTYSDAFGTTVRKIRKPKSGTVRVAINGTEVFAWALDYTTGELTFSTAPANGALITWGGEFYVPVRFGEGTAEVLAMNAEAFGAGSVVDIPLIELLDEELMPEDRWFGGSEFASIGANAGVAVAFSSVVWVIDPGGSGKKVYLPDLLGMPRGGPFLLLVNASATFSMDVQKLNAPGGTSYSSYFTLAALSTALLFIGVDSSDVSTWERH